MLSRAYVALLAAAIIFGFISFGTAQESAANYPSRPVEFVVPFAAGGSADVIARMVTQVVAEEWKQAVVVQNKPGATGAVASEYVARAVPDGYTLLLATGSTHAVLPAYRHDLTYDTVTSFAPATLVSTFPNMLVVNPRKVPARTVAEFIAYLKEHPGKLNYSSTGSGGSVHFTAELFKLMTHTEMTHVPYKGGGPALSDLLAGTVDLTFDNMATVWPQVQQGNLSVLGVASLERTPLAPNVPAIAETVPGFDATTWVGVVAPAGTPAPIVGKIAAAFAAAAKRPDVVKQLESLGATPAGDTPAEFLQFIKTDRARWEAVAAAAHLSAAK
jgi:tripartite-type tricarboxylate transporter receptor subunit TctC